MLKTRSGRYCFVSGLCCAVQWSAKERPEIVAIEALSC
jgi:hypothetical protein